ncbi:MAG: GNAT family N-acetyltransferase [Defluviitaleaceae bacterium]|nr:GNAT family N-acetyltransferase [Defluviitaleaceae bacterium]
MVELRKISIGNIIKCLRLKLLPEQKGFVASNRNSLVQAFGLNRRMIGKGSVATPYAIYANGTMVGFIMYGFFTKKFDNKHGEDYYYFWRFMIDKNHQGKGYASQALAQILDEIGQKPHGEANFCYVSYEPTNTVVRTWYQSLGFEETGQIDEGELVARMKI